MSAYTILRLMISVLVMNQSVSTQSTPSITSDQPEVTLLAMMNRSSENVNANATRTHFALNGTGDFSYVESNFMNGLPRSNNPLQQLLTQVQNSMHKYVIFTVNIFSFFQLHHNDCGPAKRCSEVQFDRVHPGYCHVQHPHYSTLRHVCCERL